VANFDSGVRFSSNSSQRAAELRRLVGRQQTENPVRRDGLALVLLRHGGGVVGKRISGVDFHQIVDNQHLQDVQHVEVRPVRVFREHDYAKAKVPRSARRRFPRGGSAS
jgi:hypothetical protein